MKAKKRKKTRKKSHAISLIPPLSGQAEVAFYEDVQKQYRNYRQSLGQDAIDVIDLPPEFSFEEKKGTNNRNPGWSGVFSFTFRWKEADQQVRQDIWRSFTADYGGEIVEGEEGWDVRVRTTGKRVKALTRMLNRQYARGYLVWRET